MSGGAVPLEAVAPVLLGALPLTKVGSASQKAEKSS